MNEKNESDVYGSWNAALQQEHRARAAFLHALFTEHVTCHTSVLFSLRVQARKESEAICQTPTAKAAAL